MKLLKKILAAALVALVPATVDASQATYTTPTTGPMSFSTFVSSYLNPALAAVLSNNSGTTAPAVTGQPGTFQFWVDTSTTPRVLKLYDGTSWLALGTIDTSGHFWGLSASTLKLLGSSSGTATLTPQAAAGTPTITLPTSTGTLADTVSAPLALNTTTGNVTVTGAAGQVLAGSTPAFTNTPTLGVAGASTGTLALTGVTSGTATITPQATAGSPTLTLPNTTGTFADGASAPLALSATTGNLTVTGAAGQVLAGSTPAFTATPTLGVAGSTVGTLAFANATSGSITVSPPTGALGAVTLSLPDATDTLIGKATTDTLTNKTYDTAGTGNSFSINGVAATANTGTGAVARANNPAFTTPNIGTPSAGVLTNATGLPLTTGVTGTLGLGNGGTGQTTAAAARASSGLNVDAFTGHGDSIYTILATDKVVGTNAAFTASRTWTLPAANAVNAGQPLVIADFAGGVTGVNTLVIARAGSDTINGATSATIVVANGAYLLYSDGVSKWTAQSVGAASAGGVTSITAGTGLTGGTITTSGTIAVGSGVVQAGSTNTLTVGYTVTANSLGNITSFTVNPALGNYQYGTNHAAATWTAPTSDCAIDVLVTNDATAGTITFSGFTVGANTGDPLTTTNTSKFLITIVRINAVSTYSVKALQ